ncbi:MAG: bifunctional glycosyltransferase family 2/GtrA family protein [Clostridiales bacterium]|nr:bifunctional glycosyltransferase family 2/GtrA family protein [Clostridiales bacterium]
MIPIVIPSYEPDERFPAILEEIKTAGLGPVVVVDDGSGDEYQAFFDRAQELVAPLGGVVLHHEVNKGKGRALKTAFSYILENMPDAIGCVTADSDGQHSVKCIKKCMDALTEHPDSLVLGVRDFSCKDVPFKSRAGNTITIKVCSYLCGVRVSDTQTGLRGIPEAFMKDLLNVEGERFEFETQMLIETRDRYPIFEVPIETIYDSKENHQTHFNPVKDSIRIYKIFGKIFARFLFTSLSSCVIDLLLFHIFCKIFGNIIGAAYYAAVATVLARIISATYNYLANYRFVFKSGKGHSTSLPRYIALAVVQMSLSAGLVTLFVFLFPAAPELVFKIPVDVVLFLASYYIQRRFVY